MKPDREADTLSGRPDDKVYVIGNDFHGNAKDVRAVKRLLHDLFGVPVADKMHPVNPAVRREARNRLEALGWAVKDEGRSVRYSLHREL